MRFRAVLEQHGRTATGIEHARQVTSAKAAENRSRRIAKVLDSLIPT